MALTTTEIKEMIKERENNKIYIKDSKLPIQRRGPLWRELNAEIIVLKKVIETPSKIFSSNKLPIKDLKPGMKRIFLKVEIIAKQEVREYKGNKVTTARIRDNTGECDLDLWNDYTNFNEGDIVEIKDALIKKAEYEKDGQMISDICVTPGLYGKIEKVV